VTRRSRMRELVFKTLFQNEFRNEQIQDVLSEVLGSEKTASIRRDARRYIQGLSRNARLIDQVISQHLENWSIDSLASVDRNVLRLGTYELLFEMDIPIEVTIDEAVEIAKRYGTENSGKFVNGVLDKIAKTTVPEEKLYL